MKVRYQADNDLRKAIVRGAVRREPRMDFRSAQTARLDEVPDPDVLALAADDGRILVSHDFDTMPRHFLVFTQRGRSPGVLLVRQDLPIGEAIETLLLMGRFRSERMGESTLPCAKPGHDYGGRPGMRYAAYQVASPRRGASQGRAFLVQVKFDPVPKSLLGIYPSRRSARNVQSVF